MPQTISKRGQGETNTVPGARGEPTADRTQGGDPHTANPQGRARAPGDLKRDPRAEQHGEGGSQEGTPPTARPAAGTTAGARATAGTLPPKHTARAEANQRKAQAPSTARGDSQSKAKQPPGTNSQRKRLRRGWLGDRPPRTACLCDVQRA